MTNSIVKQENDLAVMPVIDIQTAVHRRDSIVQFVQSIMVEGTDFGTIPGTNDKNVLLKPGAEKLTTFFGLSKQFDIIERVEDWNGDEPFFYYLYRCKLYRGDTLIAEGDGSCNSHESKYRWRWVTVDELPSNLHPDDLVSRKTTVSEFEFAINKRETGGKYGKPVEYWDEFEAAIKAGEARQFKKKTSSGKEFTAWEIASIAYRVPNPDVASVVNTIQKMAQKRALIASTLLAVNASEFFTQDLEDFEVGTVVEGQYSEIQDLQPLKSQAPDSKPVQAAKGPMQPKEQPEMTRNGNGNGSVGATEFWGYQRAKDIDRDAAKQILDENGQDFSKALEALKEANDLVPPAQEAPAQTIEDEIPF